MYSKNDYRYYLEHQLMYSDDFLAHYGVKGMKWKHHKKAQQDTLNDVIIPDQIERDVIIPDKKVVDTAKRTTSKNRWPKSTVDTTPKKKKKVEIISFKDQKTGKEYKVSSGTPPKFKPKNQKVEIITNKKKKRSKRDAKWNKQMQQYGREILEGK